jgi:threonyl-tRNA synthetase
VASRVSVEGYRVIVDDSNETVGKKIRSAELQKIPYILVVGEKEMTSDAVAVRKLHDKKIEVVKLAKFIEAIGKE